MDDGDTTVLEQPAEPVERTEAIPPVETPPDPTLELARVREENARLRGENTALRETRREPPPPPPPADRPADALAVIEKAFAAGEISEAERSVRLGALGAEAAIERRARQEREEAARTRDDQARQRSGQRIAVYLEKYPGLNQATGPEMARVIPHLRAVAEEFGLEAADPRAQVLALERTFGPMERSAVVDTHEFERRRRPVGGGGGGGGDEPPASAPKESHGERIFNMLLPEFQQFFLTTRGSKEAAIKTLQHADEHQMRKQGRFR